MRKLYLLGKFPAQRIANTLNAADHGGFEFSLCEAMLHLVAALLPGSSRDDSCGATIGCNSNIAIYFFNNSVSIGIYDGGSPSAAITNNVFDTNPGRQALQIGGIQGMLMEHNTFRNVTLGIGTKSANQPHSQPGCGADCVIC